MTTWLWDRDPRDDQVWETLERVVAALVALTDNFVFVSASSDLWPADGVYVQMCQEADGDVTLEAVGDHYLDPPLPADCVNTLRELGWEDPPGEGLPNYVQYIEADGTAPADIAHTLVTTLRRVYGVRADAIFEFGPARLAADVLHEHFADEMARLRIATVVRDAHAPTEDAVDRGAPSQTSTSIDELVDWARRNPDRFSPESVDFLRDLRTTFPHHPSEVPLPSLVKVLDEIQTHGPISRIEAESPWARALQARSLSHPVLLRHALDDPCALVRYSVVTNKATPAEAVGRATRDRDPAVMFAACDRFAQRAVRLRSLILPSELLDHTCDDQGDIAPERPFDEAAVEGTLSLLAWICWAVPSASVVAEEWRSTWRWRLDPDPSRSLKIRVGSDGSVHDRGLVPVLSTKQLDSTSAAEAAGHVLARLSDQGVTVLADRVPQTGEDVWSRPMHGMAQRLQLLAEIAAENPLITKFTPVAFDGVPLDPQDPRIDVGNVWSLTLQSIRADQEVERVSWTVDLERTDPALLERILLISDDIRSGYWLGADSPSPSVPQGGTPTLDSDLVRPSGRTARDKLQALEQLVGRHLLSKGIRAELRRDGLLVRHEEVATHIRCSAFGPDDRLRLSIRSRGFVLANVRAGDELRSALDEMCREYVFGNAQVLTYENGGNRIVFQHTILGDPLSLPELDLAIEMVTSTAGHLARALQPRFGGLTYSEESTPSR